MDDIRPFLCSLGSAHAHVRDTCSVTFTQLPFNLCRVGGPGVEVGSEKLGGWVVAPWTVLGDRERGRAA